MKFIYSEKATKFCEIFTLPLSYVVPVKSKGKILQNFVAFSEYMNFTPNPVTTNFKMLFRSVRSCSHHFEKALEKQLWAKLSSFKLMIFFCM